MFNIVSIVFATILITIGSFEVFNYKKTLDNNVITYNKVENLKFLQNIINKNIKNYTYVKPSNVMLENTKNLNTYTDILFENYLNYLRKYNKLPKSCQVLNTNYCKDIINKNVYFVKINPNGNLENKNLLTLNNKNLILYNKLIEKNKNLYLSNIINKRNLIDTNILNTKNYFNFITLK